MSPAATIDTGDSDTVVSHAVARRMHLINKMERCTVTPPCSSVPFFSPPRETTVSEASVSMIVSCNSRLVSQMLGASQQDRIRIMLLF